MIQSLILYFQFFTRIPIPLAVPEPIEKMRSGVKYFTFFGLLLGLLESIIFWGLLQFFEPMLAWLVILLFDVLLTGGFHLDALSDMADGLFSSRNKERMLAIMKDSRVGSNGVLAVVFYYGFLWFAFQSLLPVLHETGCLAVVLTFNLIGKNGISLLFYHMSYAGADPQGLGQSFVAVKTQDIVMAQLLTAVVLGLLFKELAAVIYVLLLLFTVIYRKFVLNKVAGFNGDTLGAGSPLNQVVYLLILCGLRGWL